MTDFFSFWKHTALIHTSVSSSNHFRISGRIDFVNVVPIEVAFESPFHFYFRTCDQFSSLSIACAKHWTIVTACMSAITKCIFMNNHLCASLTSIISEYVVLLSVVFSIYCAMFLCPGVLRGEGAKTERKCRHKSRRTAERRIRRPELRLHPASGGGGLAALRAQGQNRKGTDTVPPLLSCHIHRMRARRKHNKAFRLF
jgi:hypothetical protein